MERLVMGLIRAVRRFVGRRIALALQPMLAQKHAVIDAVLDECERSGEPFVLTDAEWKAQVASYLKAEESNLLLDADRARMARIARLSGRSWPPESL